MGARLDAGFRGGRTAGDADLERTVTIRGEPHSVMQAINRPVAHYAYHCGQIVFWRSISGVTAEVIERAARRAGGVQKEGWAGEASQR